MAEIGMTKALVEKKDRIAIVTINAPEKKNCFAVGTKKGDYDFIEFNRYWFGLFQELKYDPDVRVVVVTGAGDAFSAGADIKEWGNMEAYYKKTGKRPREATVVHEGTTLPYLWLKALQKPSIAMVNGLAIGMGADLALCCDMRVASDKAWFWWAYILRGMVPMDGACWLLPRLVGQAKAMEILMTGDKVPAEEAFKLGILNKVVPHDKLKEATMELATKIANGPLAAIQLVRYTVYCSEKQSFQETLDLSMLAANMERESIAEGMIAAGVEKRQADFKNI